jgi:hypothetical protein
VVIIGGVYTGREASMVNMRRRDFITLLGGAPVCERSNRALANAS